MALFFVTSVYPLSFGSLCYNLLGTFCTWKGFLDLADFGNINILECTWHYSKRKITASKYFTESMPGSVREQIENLILKQQYNPTETYILNNLMFLKNFPWKEDSCIGLGARKLISNDDIEKYVISPRLEIDSEALDLKDLTGTEKRPGFLINAISKAQSKQMSVIFKNCEFLDPKCRRYLCELLEFGVIPRSDYLDYEVDITGISFFAATKHKALVSNELLKYFDVEKVDHESIESIENLLSVDLSHCDLPSEVRKSCEKDLDEIQRAVKFNNNFYTAAEHLKLLLRLPWKKSVSFRENHSIKQSLEEAKVFLDKNHFGMQDVKESILNYLFYRSLGSPAGKVLLLVGQPGTGKTSIAASIAGALGLSFQKISLAGLNHPNQIKGWPRSYVSAAPGFLVTMLAKASNQSALFLLDEVDKATPGEGWSHVSGLLEALDQEQNYSFFDNYLGLGVDLSSVFFVLTANEETFIPRPLSDRCHIIQCPGYSPEEKLLIAKKYIIPEIKARFGDCKGFDFSDDYLARVVMEHKNDPGIRGLKRNLESDLINFLRKTLKNT